MHDNCHEVTCCTTHCSVCQLLCTYSDRPGLTLSVLRWCLTCHLSVCVRWLVLGDWMQGRGIHPTATLLLHKQDNTSTATSLSPHNILTHPAPYPTITSPTHNPITPSHHSSHPHTSTTPSHITSPSLAPATLIRAVGGNLEVVRPLGEGYKMSRAKKFFSYFSLSYR